MLYFPGFDIQSVGDSLQFKYGKDVFGPPKPELRKLEDIRESLQDPHCTGPEILYSIAMDVGKISDIDVIKNRNLLYGVVTYSKGKMGNEAIRSQGHIHAVSRSCGYSTCEVYEILDGEAYVYMQEAEDSDVCNCYAVYGRPGDIIIVPPGWIHTTINADTTKNMTFGAWCVRDYAFEYDKIRQKNGIAFFPLIKGSKITWGSNPCYQNTRLKLVEARSYPEFNLKEKIPVYTQFREEPDKFLFVADPTKTNISWENLNKDFN